MLLYKDSLDSTSCRLSNTPDRAGVTLAAEATTVTRAARRGSLGQNRLILQIAGCPRRGGGGWNVSLWSNFGRGLVRAAREWRATSRVLILETGTWQDSANSSPARRCPAVARCANS